MMIHSMSGAQTEQWRSKKIGYLVTVDNDVLSLRVDQEFLDACGNRAWANLVSKRYPGPWRQVVLLLDQCPVVNSTLLSEILHLREVFGRNKTEIVLRHPSHRMRTMIDIMTLDALFTIEPGP